MNRFKTFLLLIMWLFLLGSLMASMPSTASLADDLILTGFVADNLYGPNWSSSGLIDRVTELNSDLLKYPGGTAANYWDWRQGWLMSKLPASAPDGFVYLKNRKIWMKDFKIAVDRSQTSPLFCLNILSSTLKQQLAMMDDADSQNISVEFLELGHRLSENQNFSSAQEYGEKALDWARTFKQRWPNAKIAATGSTVDSEWNRQLAELIIQNPGVIEAVSFSPRIVLPAQSARLTNSTRLELLVDFPALKAEIRRQISDLQVQLSYFPADLEIWISGFSIRDPSFTIGASWLQGLLILETGLYLAALEPSPRILLFDSLMGTAEEAALITAESLHRRFFDLKRHRLELSAAGESLKILIRELKQTGKVLETPAPAYIAGQDQLSVWKLGNIDGSVTAIIINWSGEPTEIELTGMSHTPQIARYTAAGMFLPVLGDLRPRVEINPRIDFPWLSLPPDSITVINNFNHHR